MFTALAQKIRYKIKQEFIFALIDLSLFFRWPFLTALAFYLAAGTVNPRIKGLYTVLCMGRSIFVDDVKAMAAYSGRVRYLIMWRTYLQMVFDHFINGPEREKITEENYHTHDYCRAGKENYRRYLDKMFPWLKKFMGFDAVMCCNVGYLDQQELARVCQERKVPLIVLHKEGMVLKETYGKYTSYIQGRKFIGTKMFFYNSNIRRAYLSANVPGVRTDNTLVVGIPRLDHYLREKLAAAGKQIAFFSFSAIDKFIFLSENAGLPPLKKRADDFHAWVMEFARRHPDYKVIIKTKSAGHYLDYVRQIFKNRFEEDVANLVITNAADAKELIKRSAAVLGFASTTLVEASLIDKTIISPYFEDLTSFRPLDHFYGYADLINYAKSYEELEKMILRPEKRNYAAEEKEKFLNSYVFQPDGRASQRAEAAIIETIANY